MNRKFTTNARVVTDLFAQYPSTFNAFCELLNNSIQANAKNISLLIDYPNDTELTSLIVNKIEIQDDGYGVPISELESRLLDIGTNSKYGGKGIGRFSALQLGSNIQIESVAFDPQIKKCTKLYFSVEEEFFSNTKNVSDVKIDVNEEILENETNPYYKITINNFYNSVITDSQPKKKISQELRSENLNKAIFEKYAIKIFNQEVVFHINGVRLNSDNFIIGEPDKIKTIFTDKNGKSNDMFFTFFNINLEKPTVKIFFTVENAGIDSVVAAYEYTDENISNSNLGSYFIYVKSPLFTLDSLRNLELDEMDNDLKQIKDFIKEKIGNVLKQKGKILDAFLEKLRKDKFNPLNNNLYNRSLTKKTVFEKFVYLVEKEYHLLDKSNPIREILYSLIERSISNGDLRIILDKINQLDDGFVSRFKALLDNVELESVLEFSEKVAKKLSNLYFLEEVTCGKMSKYINERKDLHVWLVKLQMMWIFGEQYNDATNLLSDKSLENNLTNLRDEIMKYSPDDKEDNYSIIEDAEIGSITDLFLYSEKIIDPENREVIIVEIKAPHVKISNKELSQVQRYAYEIGSKQFFPKKIKYNIILISSDINGYAKNVLRGTSVARKTNNPYFYWSNEEGNIEISVMRWIDLIELNKRKLTYLSSQLEIKDLTVQQKIEQEFGDEEFEKIKGRMTKSRPTVTTT